MKIVKMEIEQKNGKTYETVNKIENMAYALEQYAEMLTGKYLYKYPNMKIETVQNYNGTETVKVYHGNGYRTVYTVAR